MITLYNGQVKSLKYYLNNCVQWAGKMNEHTDALAVISEARQTELHQKSLSQDIGTVAEMPTWDNDNKEGQASKKGRKFRLQK